MAMRGGGRRSGQRAPRAETRKRRPAKQKSRRRALRESGSVIGLRVAEQR
jgi:hypothetical protein